MEQNVCYTWMESPTGRLLLAGDEAGLRTYHVRTGDAASGVA